MGRTLVLSGGTRHGLVASRQLNRAGVTVTAAGSSRLSPARVSRHTDDFLRYPDPTADTAAFQRAVERELERRDYDLLLPVDGGTIEPVVDARDRLEPHATVPLPPTERSSSATTRSERWRWPRKSASRTHRRRVHRTWASTRWTRGWTTPWS